MLPARAYDPRPVPTAAAPRRAPSRALVALFVIGIGLPALGTLFGVATGVHFGEHRVPAPPPTLTGAPLRELPRQVEAWVRDHFGFRRPLVVLDGAVKYFVFGVSSSPQVLLGRDGWLFFAADRIVESRRGVLPFTTDELAAWQARLEERRDWLARFGIRYLFVIAPEKSSVYGEYLPTVHRPGGRSRTDQLVAWMRAHSTVAVLDLRPALLAAKATDRLYHRTDSHWNDVGAFAAYGEIAAWLRTEFPALRPLARRHFARSVVDWRGGDLAGILGLAGILAEERIQLTPRLPSAVVAEPATPLMEARASFGPLVFASVPGEIGRAVIVRDSFFDALTGPVTVHFRRSVLVHRIFPPEIILDEQPDVVIEEMVERHFSRPGFLPESELADW